MSTLADSDYPLLDVFWSMTIFFAWVMWVWLLMVILLDVFGRDDMSGGMKAMWTFAVILLPLFGVLMYLVTQSGSMAQRRAKQVQQRSDFAAYTRSGGSSNGSSSTAQISQAKELLDNGAISSDEFEVLKQKALAG